MNYLRIMKGDISQADLSQAGRKLPERKKRRRGLALLLSEILKYDPNQPRDKGGRWTTGGAFSSEAFEKRMVNYKPDRSLTGKDARDLDKLLPNTEYVPYSKTPFFDEVNRMQGTPDPMAVSAEDYVKARDTLFFKQPIEKVPMDKLVVTQEKVNRKRVKQIQNDPKTGGTKPIHVVRYGGKSYILNGHHRVAAEVLSGATKMTAHVLHIKKKGYAEILHGG